MSTKQLKKNVILTMNQNGSTFKEIVCAIANLFKEPFLDSKVCD
jgi:hypothetical protein